MQTTELALQKGEQCQKKNAYYMCIIESKEVDRKASIILKGYVSHHITVCPNELCPIRAYRKQMMLEHSKSGDN